MLEARSVAVVGASPRPGSFGEELMVQLVRGGFDGAIYPVNPHYREVLGVPCRPRIAELPEPVDLAILGVGNERLEEQLAAAAAAGAGAAVLFTSCHEPPRQGVPPLAERLRRIAVDAGMLVAAMAPPGVELALGVVRDPQFGPLVMVAAGGVLVELLRDRRFGLAPLGPRAASAMLDRLAVRPLLDGVRGARPADLDAVADAVARLSVLAADLGGWLDALDVNPLIAGPDGCLAVDALVLPVGQLIPGRGDGATARS